MKDNLDIAEDLAELVHDQRAGWMRYMFAKCKRNLFGQVVIPKSLVKRWKRQMSTMYDELPEIEKESDRIEALKFLRLFKEFVVEIDKLQ